MSSPWKSDEQNRSLHGQCMGRRNDKFPQAEKIS
jgi:hypothetical protein